MFFDRHNQKNSSEKEASGDITCTSCFGNNNRCGLRLQLFGTGSHRASWCNRSYGTYWSKRVSRCDWSYGTKRMPGSSRALQVLWARRESLVCQALWGLPEKPAQPERQAQPVQPEQQAQPVQPERQAQPVLSEQTARLVLLAQRQLRQRQ